MVCNLLNDQHSYARSAGIYRGFAQIHRIGLDSENVNPAKMKFCLQIAMTLSSKQTISDLQGVHKVCTH